MLAYYWGLEYDKDIRMRQVTEPLHSPDSRLRVKSQTSSW